MTLFKKGKGIITNVVCSTFRKTKEEVSLRIWYPSKSISLDGEEENVQKE